MPEVRGTAKFHGGAYPPWHTPPSYALTTVIIISLRTDMLRPIVLTLRDEDAFSHRF